MSYTNPFLGQDNNATNNPNVQDSNNLHNFGEKRIIQNKDNSLEDGHNPDRQRRMPSGRGMVAPKQQTPEVPKTRTPVRQSIQKQTDENSIFGSLLNENEEDYGNSSSNKEYYFEGEDAILKEIAAYQKKLHSKYSGGIKRSRIITADILLKAPEDYFDKYTETVQAGINSVRNNLTETGKSDVIRRASDNPTDDAYQDEAYYVAYSLASEYVNTTIWRDTHKSIILTLICNEIVGFGRIDPLWRDRKIDEIICNGPYDVQVEIHGEFYKVPSCKFDSADHLMSLIDRLYAAIDKRLSPITPQQKGRLHDKSRMYAVHQAVAPDGPNFNIRRHPEGFWTPEALIARGAASEEVMTFIGNLIYKGGSPLVIGGTSTGKTSMLNALTGFYKPRVRILTLEDNLEMKPNPKKFFAAAMECRDPSPERLNDRGTTMRDLVKGALQMNPDVLIIGEVTDDAAYDLCQALNTGHAGSSTIHANGPNEGIGRVASLIAQGGIVTGEGALTMISDAFDIIITIRHFPVDGSRRIVSVSEVGRNPILVDGRMIVETFPIWEFRETGLNAEKKITGYWEKVGDISPARIKSKMLDLEDDLTWDELRELSSLPEGAEKHQ